MSFSLVYLLYNKTFNKTANRFYQKRHIQLYAEKLTLLLSFIPYFYVNIFMFSFTDMDIQVSYSILLNLAYFRVLQNTLLFLHGL